MSNNINTELFERAAECISYFEGKLPAELIQKDLDNNDLESLFQHVKEAEQVIYQLEYNPEEVYGSEEQVTRAEEIADGLREDGHVF